LIFAALFGIINLNSINVCAVEHNYILEDDNNVTDFENRGMKLINTIDLKNGVVCEVYEKIQTSRVSVDATKTTDEEYIHDFNLYVNDKSIGYLEQITKWRIDKVHQPKFLSGSDKLHTVDSNKYRMKNGGTRVENYGTLAKKYTRRVTLEINGKAVETTDFSTVVSKGGNAFPVAAPVK
jgi:hypothetical protein